MKFLLFTVKAVLFLVIVVAILTAVLYTVKNKEKKTITDEVRKNTPGQFVALTAGYTHYEIAGPDTGKVVVLVHGFSVPYYIWDGTFKYLVSKGYRVLRYDTYGRGFSDRPFITYHNSVFMDQLEQLITKLQIKQPVNLVGLSFGCAIVSDFTCLHSAMVNKVVLMDPVYHFEKPKLPQFVNIFENAIDPDDMAMGQLKDFKYPERHGDWVGKYKVQMQYKNFRWATESTRYNYVFNAKESYSCLDRQHKNVLLIWARDDKTVPFKFSDSVRSVLKTAFYPVTDSGHLPQIEQPDSVNARLLAFLKQ